MVDEEVTVRNLFVVNERSTRGQVGGRTYPYTAPFFNETIRK